MIELLPVHSVNQSKEQLSPKNLDFLQDIDEEFSLLIGENEFSGFPGDDTVDDDDISFSAI